MTKAVEDLLLEYTEVGKKVRLLEKRRGEILKEVRNICRHEKWTVLEGSPYSSARHKKCNYCNLVVLITETSN